MRPPESAPRPGVHRWLRRALLAAGLICILVGVGLIGLPLIGVWQRGQADVSALKAWNNGGSNAVAGAVGSLAPGTQPTKLSCGSDDRANFALVTFHDPAQYDYAGVAGNGNWNLLKSRSIVHWMGSPNPGQAGNVIIAFHREPDFEYINQLGVGGIITLENTTCQQFNYRVTQVWVLSPNNVTQLTPTTGHELTMITCTPFWVDSQRIVWRATLVSPPAT